MRSRSPCIVDGKCVYTEVLISSFPASVISHGVRCDSNAISFSFYPGRIWFAWLAKPIWPMVETAPCPSYKTFLLITPSPWLIHFLSAIQVSYTPSAHSIILFSMSDEMLISTFHSMGSGYETSATIPHAWITEGEVPVHVHGPPIPFDNMSLAPENPVITPSLRLYPLFPRREP